MCCSSSSSSSSSSNYSPWDLPALSAFRHSNLQCFLRSTTPSLPQSSYGWWWDGEDDETRRVLRLRLKEVWRCYHEWSAYGAAVPILLPTLDTTVQYYSPSLSALQIYTTTPSSTSHSETFVRGARAGYSYCQYNEICSPYDRGPLTQKINELANDFPGLMELSASHLSPYSWMAVAWYPLYQIPTVMNEQELFASFLTYHRFSFSSQGPERFISDSHIKMQQGTYNRNEPGDKKSSNLWLAPFGVATYKLSKRIWINPEMPDEEILVSYQKAAVSWLEQVHFQHHDFNFMFPKPQQLEDTCDGTSDML